MAHLLGRCESDTAPCRPAVHLALRAAAEPQQLRPEFLDKVEQAGNRSFLLFISTAECQARDVNMKSTSPGRVAEITHTLSLAKHLLPRHFVQMIFQRHRVGNELQSFVQTAVCLDVEIFGILVGDVEQLLSVIVYRAAVINLQFNAEMPQTFAVKYKVGRVAVFVNDLAVLIPAGRAVSVVVTVPVRAVAVDNPAAVLAADVILIEAVVAECVRVILDSVFLVDPLSAVITDYGQAICAILAELVTFHLVYVINRMLCTAVCTNSYFTHCLFLHFVW